MVLESLESETPNIKDLSVETTEQKPKFRFEIEKVFGEGFLQGVLQSIEVDREKYAHIYNNVDKYDQEFFDAARNAVIELACLKTLLPEKVDEFINNDENYKFLSVLKHLNMRYLMPDIDNVHDYEVEDQMAYWRLLYPEQVTLTKQYQELDSSKISSLNTAKAQVRKRVFFNTIFDYKLLNFEIPEESITEDDWNKQMAVIEAERASKNWDYLIVDLARLKIIDSKKFEQIKLTETDWRDMLDFCKSINEDYLEYSALARKFKLAFELAIIAADKIDIDEDGIHLSDDPVERSIQETLPPMPEQRSF